jgi:hypothetical protein
VNDATLRRSEEERFVLFVVGCCEKVLRLQCEWCAPGGAAVARADCNGGDPEEGGGDVRFATIL